MGVDPKIADAYWSPINGSFRTTSSPSEQQQWWGIPCDATLPDFELEIGTGKAVIPGWLMNAGRILNLGLLPCE